MHQTVSATAAEQHSEEQLRIVLNAMPVAVTWARMEDARILFMNRTLTEMFGYTPDDITTVEEWAEKVYPNPEQRANASTRWNEFFSNPTREVFEIDSVEVDIRCKDGTIKTTILGGIILPEAGWALATFVDISARKQDELVIRSLAEEDTLTKLANRRSFDACLERSVTEALREQSSMHLLLLDLDDFKIVNDTHGHQAGDLLLQETAKRLRACVRSSDFIARFGGDEFAIILPNSGDEMNIRRICKKIVESMSQPIVLSGKEVNVGVSIGIGSMPEDGKDANSLFAAADKALYKSKRECRGRWSTHKAG